MSNQISGNGSSGKSKAGTKGFYIVLLLCIIAIGITCFVVAKNSRPVEDERMNGVLQSDNKPAMDSVIVEDKSKDQQTKDSTQDKKENETEIPKAGTITKDSTTQNESKTTPANSDKVSKQGYVKPVSGDVLTGFSREELVFSQTMSDWRVHAGVDYKASIGTAVKAIADGTVSKVFFDDLMGQTVVIEHADGLISSYSNLTQDAPVKQGQTVKQGDTIGGVGDTAISELAQEPHLHFEAIKNGEQIDPKTLFE